MFAVCCTSAAVAAALFFSASASAPVVNTAPPDPQSADLTLVMSERFLNNRVRGDAATSGLGLPISDLTLDVKPDNRMIATFKIGLPLIGGQNLSVPMQLANENGKVTVKAVETPLGQVQVAIGISDIVNKQINDRVSRTGESVQFEVISMTTTEDALTLVLHARE